MEPWTRGSSHRIISLVICCALTTMPLFSRSDGQLYHNYSRLFDYKFGPNSAYKPTIRPRFNHSQITEVTVTFDIIAIVEVEATTQKLVINGFMGLNWTDELLAWDTSQYNVYIIRPELKNVWHPRMILMNTMEKRYIFYDDASPLTVVWNGYVHWNPGSLFPTSCRMDLYKYPFDEQECQIELYSLGLGVREVMFTSSIHIVGTKYYVGSGEWSIESTRVETGGDPGPKAVSYIRIHFHLKRLPGFFIVNIVAPIVLMSFLNILVFLIPVESGEKIGYGISVLLALSVFMSVVSDQLPNSSDPLPIVTVYLLVLTIISVCTVMMSIVIVYLHHRDEKEVQHQVASANFKATLHDFSIMNRAVKNFSEVHRIRPASADSRFPNLSMEHSNGESSSENRKRGTETIVHALNGKQQENGDKNVERTSRSLNRWRQIGRHLDLISFVVFTVIWLSVTIGFLVEMAL